MFESPLSVQYYIYNRGGIEIDSLEVNRNGSITLRGSANGIQEKNTYYGYSKRDAIKAFKNYLNGIKNRKD